MYPTRNSPLSPAKRVRILWSELEGWAEIQVKILDRRRDDISKDQDLKWKNVLAKTRARQDEHDALKAKLLREAQDDHLSKVQMEWQARLAKANLRDQDWGEMTIQEVQTVEKVLGGVLDDEPPGPVVQNVVTQPQHLSIPVSNPAPRLSSTARAVNLSTSTTSSYTLVSVNEFSTDDELYEAVSSYIVVSHPSISLPTSLRTMNTSLCPCQLSAAINGGWAFTMLLLPTTAPRQGPQTSFRVPMITSPTTLPSLVQRSALHLLNDPRT